MIVGIPQERSKDERRVAATPETAEKLIALGFEVHIEHGAGEAAFFPDAQYEEVGAKLVSSEEVWNAELVIKVQPPTDEEIERLPDGGKLLSFVWPAQNEGLVEKLAAKKVTVFGLDCIPRISRAQAMDVLSSMAAIAGYRAVVEASHQFGRYMSQQFTAAGSTPAANVLVIGAGVAGLASIATAHAMGSRVKAFDTREAVKEEIRSLGGSVLELEFEEEGEGEGGYAKVMSPAFIAAEKKLFEEEGATTDILITTAMVPGKPAPKLITEACVKAMPHGSVIVDLASAAGGNCELTEPDHIVVKHGVTIVGYRDLVSRLPAHASQFFGRNVVNLLKLMKTEDDFVVNRDDVIVRGVLVSEDGEVTWPPPAIEPTPKKEPEVQPEIPIAAAIQQAEPSSTSSFIGAAIALSLTLLVGAYAPESSVQHFTVFVLACFVGWQLIWNVAPALHTPLMSVTNAISGIIVVGGILQATSDATTAVSALAITAILVASINIFGGFLVTQRMLKMFRGGKNA